MSRKAYILPIASAQEAQVALAQLQAADIEINFAVVGPQLVCWAEPQGTPLSSGLYCYLAFTTEGTLEHYLDACPALDASFRLDGVDEEMFNKDGSLIGVTYLDEDTFYGAIRDTARQVAFDNPVQVALDALREIQVSMQPLGERRHA